MPASIEPTLMSTLKIVWKKVCEYYKCDCHMPSCSAPDCLECRMRAERGYCIHCVNYAGLADAHIVNMMPGQDEFAGTGFLVLWSNGMVTFDGEDGRVVSGEYWTVYHTVQLEPDPVKKAEAEAHLRKMGREMR